MRVALAALLCAAAVGVVWHRVGQAGGEDDGAFAARPDVLRDLVCDACGTTMKMTAADFDRARKNADPESRMLRCPQCGEPRLWRAPTAKALGDFRPSKEHVDGAIRADDDSYAPMKPTIGVDRRRKSPSQ